MARLTQSRDLIASWRMIKLVEEGHLRYTRRRNA
jgi:hypothetical protein